MGAVLEWGAVIVALVALDRLLLAAEGRRWINYRRKGFNWGASRYHILETQAVFDPGAERLQEAQVVEEKEEDDAGTPP